MFLFPVDGVMEIILSYGQTLSLYLVFVIMEGMISAKSETAVPGLVFIGLTLLLGVGLGFIFHDIGFFFYMLVPAVLSLIAFYFTRRNRRKNIEKGLTYNEDGLLEEEMKKMEQGNHE
ncbi:MAG: hypothetical protein IKT48_01520 [Anaerotignum sp.]|nr:hypothetical protein [Anaerotignum sp.]MBR5793327.1 hypothetical protein [Anaerotignum sp.]